MCKQEIVSKLKDSSKKSNNMPQIHLNPVIADEAQFLNTQSTSGNINCLWSGLDAVGALGNSWKTIQTQSKIQVLSSQRRFSFFPAFLLILSPTDFQLLSPVYRSLMKPTDRDKHFINAPSDTVEDVDLYLQLKKSALNHPAEHT